MMTWALIVLYAASIGIDGYTTQKIPHGRENNPLARPFVHSVQGEAVGCSLGFAAGVGPYFLFRKMGHKKLATRWLTTFIAGETLNDVHQLKAYAKTKSH
jgi:hypothetical protein